MKYVPMVIYLCMPVFVCGSGKQAPVGIPVLSTTPTTPIKVPPRKLSHSEITKGESLFSEEFLIQMKKQQQKEAALSATKELQGAQDVTQTSRVLSPNEPEGEAVSEESARQSDTEELFPIEE